MLRAMFSTKSKSASGEKPGTFPPKADPPLAENSCKNNAS